MLRLRARLPSLSSLVIFEAAGRHLSFTRAAAEMSITQAAVSRQIRALEEALGTRLFDRAHRGLQLTGEGRRLHQAVTMGLEHIAGALAEIRASPGGERVTVATTLAFASCWLMPRIPRFRTLHPDVDLRVLASDEDIDPVAEGVDVVVRYGASGWPGFEAVRLLDEEVFPVCSPEYLVGRPPLRTPSDLPGETLLHLEEDHPGWIDWRTWFERCGVLTPVPRRGMRVNNYTMLIQAAQDGQGIALGWRHLVDDLLARGTLVRPIGASLRTREGFNLFLPAGEAQAAEVAAFREWIVGETK